VEIKLGEQRRFVLWWDEQEKRRGTGLPSQTTDGSVAADFGLPRDTISRWRKKLKDPKKFYAALEAAQERCRRVCEADKGATEQKGASGTGENEWYTSARPGRVPCCCQAEGDAPHLRTSGSPHRSVPG
jgi:hypothetical protein